MICVVCEVFWFDIVRSCMIVVVFGVESFFLINGVDCIIQLCFCIAKLAYVYPLQCTLLLVCTWFVCLCCLSVCVCVWFHPGVRKYGPLLSISLVFFCILDDSSSGRQSVDQHTSKYQLFSDHHRF